MKAVLQIDKNSIKEFDMSLERIRERVMESCETELAEFGLYVMDISDTFIPVDTGAAKGSRFEEDVQVSMQGITVRVGYSNAESTQINPETGKPTSQYVYELHEDLMVHHPTGQAKFLENAVTANHREFYERMAKAVRQAIGG